MLGNQHIINATIASREDCLIPEKVGDVRRPEVLQIISDEYWKEWRRLLRYGETPTIYCKELGKFRIRYPQLRSYMYELIKLLRYKLEAKSELMLNPENKFHKMYLADEKKFKAAWKQADIYKKWMNDKNKKWKLKKLLRYGDDAIL